jgi:hypothetical protein
MAAIQRVRAGRPTPERNSIRTRSAEWNEAEPSFLPQGQQSAPVGGASGLLGQVNDDGVLVFQPNELVASRVEQDSAGIRAYDAADAIILNVDATNGTILAKGNITGGSITLDDTAANGVVHFLADNVGYQTRISGTTDVASSFRNSYLESPTNHHKRELVLAVDDLPASYGTAVERKVYISLRNRKIEGSVGTSDGDNMAQFQVVAQVDNDGTPGQAILTLEALNNINTLQLQNAKLWLKDNPHHKVSPLEVSNYAAGSQNWSAENSANVTLSTTAGTYTLVVNVDNVPVIAGRLYRVTFCGGDNLLKNGTGAAVGDTWSQRFRRNTGAGYASMNTSKFILRADVTADQRVLIPDMVGYFSPSATGNVDFKCEAAKTSGAAGVTSQMESGSASPFRITVEDVGWSGSVLN